MRMVLLPVKSNFFMEQRFAWLPDAKEEYNNDVTHIVAERQST